MKKTILLLLLICLALLPACKPKDSGRRTARQDGAVSVLVFITGVIAGNPYYEMLAAGALEFAAEHGNVTVKVYEAGFNQAEWEEQLISMVASGEYGLVLGSNPSLPQICANAGRAFPSQRFIITDAQHSGNPQISAYLYNQYEQALFLGYLAGLVTTSDMPHANESKRIGFIAAQEYPLLTGHIVPGFIDGARRADPDIELDFRVIGNWFDASKAADLASGMINAGVDVFTSIAGGAAQGLVRTINERAASGRASAYAVFFNSNEYSQAPGLIIGCGSMEQKKLAKEILSDFLAGNIEFGSFKTVGAREGYLNFIFDDPGFLDYLPEEIQERFAIFMDDFLAGRIEYTVPPL